MHTCTCAAGYTPNAYMNVYACVCVCACVCLLTLHFCSAFEAFVGFHRACHTLFAFVVFTSFLTDCGFYKFMMPTRTNVSTGCFCHFMYIAGNGASHNFSLLRANRQHVLQNIAGADWFDILPLPRINVSLICCSCFSSRRLNDTILAYALMMLRLVDMSCGANRHWFPFLLCRNCTNA